MATSEVEFVEGDTNSQLIVQPVNKSDGSQIPIADSNYSVTVFYAIEDLAGTLGPRKSASMATSLIATVPSATYTLLATDLLPGWLVYEYQITYPSGKVLKSLKKYRRKVRARIAA